MLKNMRKIYGLLGLGLMLQGASVNAVAGNETLADEFSQKMVESGMKRFLVAGLECAEKTLSNGGTNRLC